MHLLSHARRKVTGLRRLRALFSPCKQLTGTLLPQKRKHCTAKLITVHARSRQRARRIAGDLRLAGAFFLGFMKHPATVGSVCPSSAALVERLLNGVCREDNGLVIDLGAGSGPVSAYMLRSGIAKDRIIAVEALPDFEKAFTANCPDIRLHIADAGELKALLDREAPGRSVCAVVSSLPFRALEPQTAVAILQEIHQVLLERGGRLVQYSYAWWLRYPLQGNGFAPESTSLVWKNLPPARVESYLASTMPARTEAVAERTILGRFLHLAGIAAGRAGRAVLYASFAAVAMLVHIAAGAKQLFTEP